MAPCRHVIEMRAQTTRARRIEHTTPTAMTTAGVTRSIFRTPGRPCSLSKSAVQCSTSNSKRLMIVKQSVTIIIMPIPPSSLHHTRVRRALLAGRSASAEALKNDRTAEVEDADLWCREAWAPRSSRSLRSSRPSRPSISNVLTTFRESVAGAEVVAGVVVGKVGGDVVPSAAESRSADPRRATACNSSE